MIEIHKKVVATIFEEKKVEWASTAKFFRAGLPDGLF
jgi:hypothetical protein